jgi:F420-dependent oxidoreductase-like protein
MKISLTMLNTQRFGWHGQLEIAKAAERLGFDTLWVAEAYGFDAFTQLAAYAGDTNRIRLATGVVSVFGRSPATLAQTAATLDMISGGRFQLGLGTSSSVLAREWHGTAFDPAGTRLREAIDIIRMALARERLVYHGQCFDLGAGIRLADQPVRPRLPIYVGALTSTGLKLTAEVADGWIAAFFSPGHYASVFHPALADGLRRREAGLGPLKICVYQGVVVTDDLDAGRNAVRPRLAQYLGIMGTPEKNYYAKLFRRYGYGEQVQEVQRLYAERQREEAQMAVTDEMIDLVTIVGPTEACWERLRTLEQVGVDEVALELTVPGAEVEEFITALSRLTRSSEPATDA